MGCGLRPNPLFLIRHRLDLLQLPALDAEISSHLDDLAGTDEIARRGAEFLDAGIELATAHMRGYFKAEPAPFAFLILYTELANYHSAFLLILRRSADVATVSVAKGCPDLRGACGGRRKTVARLVSCWRQVIWRIPEAAEKRVSYTQFLITVGYGDGFVNRASPNGPNPLAFVRLR